MAGASAALAQWPTTCVELNDIVEAHLGNDHNVGIYQRTFGDQAETACQNDHRNDVRSVFAWAIGGAEVTPQPAPPAATGGSPFATHPSFETIRQEAIRRGASAELATRIAESVISRGTVQQFLNGTDSGVEYGQIDPITVSNFQTKWLDSSGSCWDLSYQFDVRNNSRIDLYFDWIDVRWLDDDGFVLDESTIFDVSLPAGDQRHFADTTLICDGLGPQVSRWEITFEAS